MKPFLPILIALAVASCQAPADAPADVGSAPEATSVAPASPTQAPDGRPATSLVWWTVPALAPGVEGDEPTLLDTSIDTYLGANPDVDLEIAVNPARGAGAVSQLLELTARVAPSELPDLVSLPLDALASEGLAGVLQPIDRAGLAPGGGEEPVWFAFADRAASVEGSSAVRAIPIAVDLVHAVSLDQEPPATWQILDAERSLTVPPAREDCRSLSPVLSLYAASGGRGDDVVEPGADDVLEALAIVGDTARRGGVSVNAVQAAAEPDAAPPSDVASFGDAAASGAAFAGQQAADDEIRWGPLPGRERPGPAVGCGWALAVTATDPDRASRARDLAEWLSSPEQRVWVVPAGYLPADRSAWAATVATAYQEPPEPAYLAFLESQLDSAVAFSGLDDWGAGLASAYGRALEGAEAPPTGTP